MISDCFPDVSFIQNARILEVEAVEGGRRANEFSISPLVGLSDDESPVSNVAVDDIQETQDRIRLVKQYVPIAQRAFEERGMTYPFSIDGNGMSLRPLAEHAGLARNCANLAADAGVGQKTAKTFELRAFRALHRLIGGWAVSVGAPRISKEGPKKSVARFRSELHPWETGDYTRARHATSGDYGMDSVWILGREWGGPLVFLQAKNSTFERSKFADELLRASDALQEWFGHRVDKLRSFIVVFAVNTVLTLDLKQRAFAACPPGAGYHILDCVDIIFAESRPADYAKTRDASLEL